MNNAMNNGGNVFDDVVRAVRDAEQMYDQSQVEVNAIRRVLTSTEADRTMLEAICLCHKIMAEKSPFTRNV